MFVWAGVSVIIIFVRGADSRYILVLVTTRYSASRYSLLGIRYINRYWLLRLVQCSARLLASLTPPSRLMPALAAPLGTRVLAPESQSSNVRVCSNE